MLTRTASLLESPPSMTDSVDSVDRAPLRGARRGIRAWLDLGKARLSILVLFTTFTGYSVSPHEPLSWVVLAATLLGTFLAAWGANALNQCVEAPRDARMRRTRNRPIPAGTLTPGLAFAVALSAAIVGPALLFLGANLTSALLAVLTIAVYVLIYTPLKVRTPLNTLVGAVVGAIPPLIGAAAAGSVGAGAWILAGVLFFWQIPHFLALAWMYRDDYARGGYRMLPGEDPDGSFTGGMTLTYSLALVPLSLAATIMGVSGWVYAFGAIVLGAAFTLAAARLWRTPSVAHARRVFLASVIYLPLLLGLMMLDRQPVTNAPRSVSPAPLSAAETAGTEKAGQR